MASPSVLFVHMPMADPVLPNLGAELLAETLRQSGGRADVYYGTLQFPPSVSAKYVHGLVGHCAFSPHYFGLDVEEFVSEVADCLFAGVSHGDRPMVEAELYTGHAAAELCLERCLDDIDTSAYDVVAFSVIFDTQKIPSAALAKCLKERKPKLQVLFGGTGCDGEMGSALLERFPEVDAVFQGDGDRSVVHVCRWLLEAKGPAPDGLLVRGSRSSAHNGPVSQSLDGRPFPNYTQYVQQRRRSAYAAVGKLTLLFEASRGCWWGAKHHCLFCGIRTVREGYREREPDEVMTELRRLHVEFAPELLYSADAILSVTHARTLLPRLAAYRASGHPDLNLFFEVKSNLNRKDVALLAAAGVVALQPGIESFSSAVLARMNKGATARRQIELLKWLRTYNIDTIYGLLLRTPGETPDDIYEQVRLARLMHHLPPPVDVNPLSLHRFSPYFVHPERYGIRNIRPHPLQRIAYQATDDVLQRLCYELAFDSSEYASPDNRAAELALRDALAAWKSSYSEGACLSSTVVGGRTLVTSGTTRTRRTRVLDDAEAAFLDAASSAASLESIEESIGVTGSMLGQLVSAMRAAGYVAHIDRHYLSLVTPSRPDAVVDAGLDPSQIHGAA